MDLKNRKVAEVRFHYDPSIGGKPQQAFNLKDMGPGSQMELTPIGVYVKAWTGVPNAKIMEEFVIPYANTQRIKLAPEEPKPEKAK